MRTNTLTVNPAIPAVNVRPRRWAEVRDPYDGLRPWSAITHGAGAALALLGTAVLLIQSAALGKWLLFGLFAVYGLSMVCLYTASTLYHCLNVSVPGRLALRKYDHCSIYLLIAGSYTPVCTAVLKSVLGTAMLTVIWVCAAAGIILTIAKLDIPRWLTSTIYVVMGWIALVAIVPLSRLLPPIGMFWLVGGGALYTIGGVLYAVKWPGRNNPRFGCHEIFHVFILLGSVFHYLMMLQVILPLF